MSENKTIEDALIQQKAKLEKKYLLEKVALLEELHSKLGEKVAMVVEEFEGRKATEFWAGIAQKTGGTSIEDLINLLWEPLAAQGMQYTSEKTDNGIQMHCTSCPIHDMAKELGITKWAYHLFCSTDPSIVAGFNPQIGFSRTKTLTQGADCCNHFYYLKE